MTIPRAISSSPSSENLKFEQCQRQIKSQIGQIPVQGIPLSNLSSLPPIDFNCFASTRLARLLQTQEQMQLPSLFQKDPLILADSSTGSVKILRSDEWLNLLGYGGMMMLAGIHFRLSPHPSSFPLELLGFSLTKVKSEIRRLATSQASAHFSAGIADLLLSIYSDRVNEGLVALNLLINTTLEDVQRHSVLSLIPVLDDIDTRLRMHPKPLSEEASWASSQINKFLANVAMKTDMIDRTFSTPPGDLYPEDLHLVVGIDPLLQIEPTSSIASLRFSEAFFIYSLLIERGNKSASEPLRHYFPSYVKDVVTSLSSGLEEMRKHDVAYHREIPYYQHYLRLYLVLEHLKNQLGIQHASKLQEMSQVFMPRDQLGEITKLEPHTKFFPLEILYLGQLAREEGRVDVAQFLETLPMSTLYDSNYYFYLGALRELAGEHQNREATFELFKMARDSHNLDAVLSLASIAYPQSLKHDLNRRNFAGYLLRLLPPKLVVEGRRYLNSLLTSDADSASEIPPFLRNRPNNEFTHPETSRGDLEIEHRVARSFLDRLRRTPEDLLQMSLKDINNELRIITDEIAWKWDTHARGGAGITVSLGDYVTRFFLDVFPKISDAALNLLPTHLRDIRALGGIFVVDGEGRLEVRYPQTSLSPTISGEATSESEVGSGSSRISDRSNDRSSNRGVEARGGRGVSPKSPSSREEGREGSDSKRGERDHGLDPIDPFNLGRRGPIK